MPPSLQFLFLLSYGFFLWCTAIEVLPRAPHAAFEPPGFAGLRDVLVARDGDLGLPSGFLPRMNQLANAAQKGISANSSSTLDKRQSTCDPGYDICEIAQTCCPSGSNCCSDGTCVNAGDLCCDSGGACSSGFTCCGATHCAPDGGECCSDGSSCDPGFHCLVIAGQIGCCATYDCTSFDSGPSPSPPLSITLPSITPLSTLPSITIPTITVPTSLATEYSWYTETIWWIYYSYFITYIGDVSQTYSQYISTTTIVSVYASNTADADSQLATLSSSINAQTAVTAPGVTNSLPSPTITFPSITIPTITVPTSLTTEYFWYTTTFTWYYYSYFITYIAPVSQRTSRYTSTTQIVSAYASNTADATSQLATLSSQFSFPTAVTAPGYTNSLPSATGSTSAGPTVSAFTGGAKGVKTGSVGLGAAAVMGCLGIFTCLLMVWL